MEGALQRGREEWRRIREATPPLATTAAGLRAWSVAVVFRALACGEARQRAQVLDWSPEAEAVRNAMLADPRMARMAELMAAAMPWEMHRGHTAWRAFLRGGGVGALRVERATDAQRAGVRGSRGGYWAVRDVLDVRRPPNRRGRQLEVLVEWEGHDQLGGCWPRSWHPIVCLRRLAAREIAAGEPDLHGLARAMEHAKYGGGGDVGKRGAEGATPDGPERRRTRRAGGRDG